MTADIDAQKSFERSGNHGGFDDAEFSLISIKKAFPAEVGRFASAGNIDRSLFQTGGRLNT
jgi:hypothetical protein